MEEWYEKLDPASDAVNGGSKSVSLPAEPGEEELHPFLPNAEEVSQRRKAKVEAFLLHDYSMVWRGPVRPTGARGLRAKEGLILTQKYLEEIASKKDEREVSGSKSALTSQAISAASLADTGQIWKNTPVHIKETAAGLTGA